MSDVKNKLLSLCKLPEEVLEVEGVGTFRIRALRREDVLELGIVGKSLTSEKLAEAERLLLSKSLIDPPFSPEEIKMVQENCPADMYDTLIDACLSLSGLAKDSAKEAVKNFRDES